MIATGPCPEQGVWRAWLDGEHDSRELLDHLPTCPTCQRVVEDLRATATLVSAALAPLAPAHRPSAHEVAAARAALYTPRRQEAHGVPREPALMFVTRLSSPWRVAASGLAAAVVLSVLVAFTPGGQSAASAFLSQFRAQSLAPIAVSAQTQADLIKTMTALGRLGTVNMPHGATRPEAAVRGAAAQAHTVSLAEATSVVGFPLVAADPKTLPAGLNGPPRIDVIASQQIQFTFEKARAVAYFQSIGRSDFVVPDRFDGATLVVSLPSAALLQYGVTTTARETVIVAQAGEVVVDVVGGKVGLDEIRAFLISLPGLPSDVVRQLQNMNSWTNTLPVPIPIDRVSWQPVTIAGNTGLLLNDNSGIGSAAIWQANGRLYGVAGSVKAVDVQRIANGLVPAS